MRHQVFIDSGAFIAFLVQRDQLHPRVKELFSRPPARWSTSLLVVSESYSWFLHRLGEETARTFRRLLLSLSGLELIGVDAAHHAEVTQKLERLRGTQLTYVDGSSLVLMEQRGISTVWGTDHHLALEGASVVPGPPAG
jgi:predicted nucleic acid-binding protein